MGPREGSSPSSSMQILQRRVVVEASSCIAVQLNRGCMAYIEGSVMTSDSQRELEGTWSKGEISELSAVVIRLFGGSI